jgi:magnesium transporter
VFIIVYTNEEFHSIRIKKREIMIRAYFSDQETMQTTQVSDLTMKNIWIHCIRPTFDELTTCSETTGASMEFLRAALDMEEGSRIEIEDDQMIVIIDIPIYDENMKNERFFDTIPLGIIILKDKIITVCLQENSITSELENGKPKIHTFKRTRFLLQLLYKTSQVYIRYLRRIDQQTDQLEIAMHKATENRKLTQLLNLQKSITYFSTSLRSNEATVSRLRSSQFGHTNDPALHEGRKFLAMYEEDQELLEDVQTENKQAIEMAGIYGRILESMGNIFSSMISNNLNMVMKFLTSITLIVSIPTLIASILGMNVTFPFDSEPLSAFWMTMVFMLMLTAVLIIILRKKNLL